LRFLVLKELLKQEKLNVNEITPKGTALHIAAKIGKLELITELLELGANPLYIKKIIFTSSLKNERGHLPFEVASNEKIRGIIENAALKVRDVMFLNFNLFLD
jgi:ankyrin repeat protein